MCNNVSNSEQISKAFEEGKTDNTDVWYRQWYALRLRDYDLIEITRKSYKSILKDIDEICKNLKEYDIEDIQDFKQELKNRIEEYIEMLVYFEPDKPEVTECDLSQNNKK